LIPSFLQRKRDREPSDSETGSTSVPSSSGTSDVAASAEQTDIFSELDKFKEEKGIKREKLFNEVSAGPDVRRIPFD
jgi:hypothetical protein